MYVGTYVCMYVCVPLNETAIEEKRMTTFNTAMEAESREWQHLSTHRAERQSTHRAERQRRRRAAQNNNEHRISHRYNYNCMTGRAIFISPGQYYHPYFPAHCFASHLRIFLNPHFLPTCNNGIYIIVTYVYKMGRILALALMLSLLQV